MITLVTIAVGPMKPVWDLAVKRWEPYCKQHGYDLCPYFVLLKPNIAPSWNKCLTVAETLRKTNEPVWWIDADMAPCNLSFALEQKFPRSDIYVSSDWNGYCFGMFRAEPTQWAIDFLSLVPLLGDVRNPDDFGAGLGVKWEQNAIKALAKTFPNVEQHIKTLPQSWVNDNPTKPRSTDFIWHYGSRNNQERIDLMRKTLGL